MPNVGNRTKSSGREISSVSNELSAYCSSQTTHRYSFPFEELFVCGLSGHGVNLNSVELTQNSFL